MQAFLDETGVLQRLPPSLAGLQHLRRLCFWLQADAITDASLPQGPWLQSIRWLGVPIKCLLAEGTLAELSAAGELEFLCSLGVPALTSLGMQVPEDFWARWDVLWSWLAAHPPLRCFG